jgi:protein involved in polysaccharide export with SLBB domain
MSGSGCASLTNPVADGVPICRLPPELLGPSRDDEVTIPLTLLGQKPPDDYRLAPGDVLGIWIEGVLGEAAVPPPVHVSPLVQVREQRGRPPAVGYPVPVRADGTISLPWVDPLAVQGLTFDAVEKALRRLYTVQKQILKPGKEKILVSLLEPRQHHVLVVRQEASAFITPIAGNVVGSGKRGTGHLVSLPPGDNDVLHALVQSGGASRPGCLQRDHRFSSRLPV